MSALTRDQILAPRPWPVEVVEVPEWGGSVRVRALTASEMDSFNASIVTTKKDGTAEVNRRNYRAKLVAKCLVQDDGKSPVFTDETDIIALGNQPVSALERILAAVNRLNAISTEEQEELLGN